MSEKAEALRLAERIDLRDYYDFDAALHCPDAARLLLSQHAEIKRLREALRTALDASWNGPMPDYARDEATAALQEVQR